MRSYAQESTCFPNSQKNVRVSWIVSVAEAKEAHPFRTDFFRFSFSDVLIVTISVQPPLPAPLPHHDLTSRNRLNLASTPAPSDSPTESAIGSPLPASVSHLSSPPASPYHPYSRAASPGPNKAQRNIIIDLSNINQVHTFFFTHLLAWRDANPTRSLGPDLVSTIIKTHYQDLALVSISLDASLTLKQNQGGLGKGANGAVIIGSGPHPGWDAYSEVPSKVYFFRQLTRWIVADFRSISYDNSKLLVA